MNEDSVSIKVNESNQQNDPQSQSQKRKPLPKRVNANQPAINQISSKNDSQMQSKIITKRSNIYQSMNSQPTSLFFMDAQGVIKDGTFSEDDSIFLKYDIFFGEEWKLINGQNSGQSQYACLGEGTNNYFVWNMPFSIRLNCSEPYSWPQLVVSCFCPDFMGREVIKAYGMCHFPTTPGLHERNLSMFSPISSDGMVGLNEFFYGKKAELIDAPKLMALGKGREILRTKSEGNISVKFNVQLEDMDKCGFDL